MNWSNILNDTSEYFSWFWQWLRLFTNICPQLDGFDVQDGMRLFVIFNFINYQLECSRTAD